MCPVENIFNCSMWHFAALHICWGSFSKLTKDGIWDEEQSAVVQPRVLTELTLYAKRPCLVICMWSWGKGSQQIHTLKIYSDILLYLMFSSLSLETGIQNWRKKKLGSVLIEGRIVSAGSTWLTTYIFIYMYGKILFAAGSHSLL